MWLAGEVDQPGCCPLMLQLRQKFQVRRGYVNFRRKKTAHFGSGDEELQITNECAEAYILDLQWVGGIFGQSPRGRATDRPCRFGLAAVKEDRCPGRKFLSCS